MTGQDELLGLFAALLIAGTGLLVVFKFSIQPKLELLAQQLNSIEDHLKRNAPGIGGFEELSQGQTVELAIRYRDMSVESLKLLADTPGLMPAARSLIQAELKRRAGEGRESAS